jgi:hypothetical protein
MGWKARVRFLAGIRNISLFTACRPVLGLTEPPTQWVYVAISLRIKVAGE